MLGDGEVSVAAFAEMHVPPIHSTKFCSSRLTDFWKDEWRKFISPECPGPRSAHAVAAAPMGGGKLFLFGIVT